MGCFKMTRIIIGYHLAAKMKVEKPPVCPPFVSVFECTEYVIQTGSVKSKINLCGSPGLEYTQFDNHRHTKLRVFFIQD